MVASEGVQRDCQSLVNCSRKGALREVDYRERESAITSYEQRHSGDIITSNVGFCTSAATTRARARRPADSVTLRIFNEGPKTGMDGTGRKLKEINLKPLSSLADNEFMQTVRCLSLFVRHVARLPSLAREAPETWSAWLLNSSR